MLDGFLLSAGARKQSVIAQPSSEAEYIAATVATSEAKHIHSSVPGLWTTREHPFAFRQLWRHWSDKQRPPTRMFESAKCQVRRTWLTPTQDLPADRGSLEFCRLNMGVIEIPKQLRDTVSWQVRHSFLVSVLSLMLTCATTVIKFGKQT